MEEKRKAGRPPKEKDLSQETIAELNRKVSLLEQEKRLLNQKLEKRKDVSDVPTKQHNLDFRSKEEMRQEDAKKVKGKFRCYKPPGGNVEFYFRLWKGDPIEKYTLVDGQEYDLPMGVIKHLNENCYEEDKEFMLDANGDKIRGAGKKNYRFSFTPLGYGRQEETNVPAAANYA